MATSQNNTLVTNEDILKTALMEFNNNLVLAKTARRDYEKNFNNTTGNTIKIRKPTRYVARVGRNASIQAIQQRYTEMTVGEMIGVDMSVTSEQLALDLDDLNREVINPAMVTLANKIDSELYALSTQFYLNAGTAGTAPSTFAVANQAKAVLTAQGIPMENRFMLLETFNASALQTALYNSFNEKFNTDIIMQGSMGNLAGFDCYDVQNVIRPSAGTDTASLGSPLIAGAGQSGATLTLDGFTASVVLKAGRLFTIVGVNSTNPTSRNDTGQLAQFVVTADTTVAVDGTVTLPISPSIQLTGPYQNVTALPADNAVLTFESTHTKNLIYHREAFAFVSVNLPTFNDAGVWQKTQVDTKSKVAIRMTRQYQVIPDELVYRFDILPAFKLFPEYGGVLMGS